MSQTCPIKLDEYPELFKYKIYECFKPKTLSTARQYIQHLIFGNVHGAQELHKYESDLIETQLPSHVNQKMILHFQSNFESGNLDSAYILNESSYNLLLKVDTNT